MIVRNSEKKKVRKTIICLFCFVFLLFIYAIAILIYPLSYQEELVCRLDKYQSGFESLEGQSLKDTSYITDILNYNKDVDIYYNYVSASNCSIRDKCFWTLFGPFNSVVYKDYEREYEKFDIVNLSFEIVERR